MASGHTVTAFDDELTRLRGMIAEMGGRAEQAIRQAIDALDTGNLALAAQVVGDDKRIDALEADVEQLAVQIIALRAPMADDLREMIASLKIASVIERIGDYAKNIGKRVPLLSEGRTIESIPMIKSMAGIVAEMLADVLDAYATRNAELAYAIIERDRSVDDFYDSIFRALVTFMMENPRVITESAHLLFIAKISNGWVTIRPTLPKWSIMSRPAPAPTIASAGPRRSTTRRRATDGRRQSVAGRG
jgi:phosphate transport system protein